MRTFAFLILAGTLIFLNGCTKDTCINQRTFSVFEPVYVLPESLDKEFSIEPAHPLKNPGKIYFYKDYIFINEPYEGFHIINNKVPSAPVNERFVKLQGNVDISVMNDYLYADAYIDLVIIDLRNMDQLKQADRKAGLFKGQYFMDNSGAILSHYKDTKITETIDCSNVNWGQEYYYCGDVVHFDKGFDPSVSSNGGPKNNGGIISGGAVGKGGSLARFTISKGHLYAIGTAELYSISISDDGSVKEPVVTSLPWGIETLFPYKDYLFVGANNGMHLISIDNPSSPQLKGTFEHARSCDPVVADDDIAFVTLREGTECQGFLNQLDIIDVKDIEKPKLLHSISLEHPHGLAVEGDYLYICEGTHGLKVFNKKDLASIKTNQVGTYKDFHAWDVISLTGHSLLVIGNDGFRQYDHSDPNNLILLSTIPVQK